MLQGKGSFAIIAGLLMLTAGLAGCAQQPADGEASTTSACLEDGEGSMEDTGDGEADSIETEASTPIEQRLSPMPSAQQGESEPITIGTLLPLTGELKQFGPDMQRAVELAAEDINNAGILSQEIEIAQGDSQTDDAQAPVSERLRDRGLTRRLPDLQA